ncbi:hypothetical protein [Campylobacter curvus]|uniref:hypothetical protein n=1 Tax=Campylobacter curvus TaxID=200 RepID=UPI00147032D2|nr:hypothetical protein [Campylobacter curvus]
MLKNLFSGFKSKVLALFSLGAVSAFAATGVTMGADGAVTGSLDLTTFYGVAGVVIVALGAVFAVKTGLRLLRG